MFGHKKDLQSYKSQSHSKGRDFVLKNPFQEPTTKPFGLQSWFPVFVISQSGLLEYD